MIRGDYTSRKVWIGDKELLPDPSLKVIKHSPDGFAWGYGGSGPSQLALAILIELLSDTHTASRHYQDFKWAYVSKWQGDFAEPVANVKKWIEDNVMKEG
jgi:hypothetical protein